MFRRLRRASRQLSLKGRQNVENGNVGDTTTYAQASLLGLPAEIRNQIYELVAANTMLTFSSSRSHRAKYTPGLIAACKRTSTEFRPVMLAWATIQVSIVDYDFSQAVRLIDKSDDDEDSLALRENHRIWIMLWLAHCVTNEYRRKLSNWLTHCTERPPYSNGLILNYGASFLPGLRPPKPTQRYTSGFQMRYDVLNSHLKMFREFADAAEGVEKQELSYIVADLEQEVQNLAVLESDRRLHLGTGRR